MFKVDVLRKMNLKFIIALLLFMQSVQENVQGALSDDAYESFLLPTSLSPTNYKLEVTTHLGDGEGFRFQGNVFISVSLIVSY